ncbi:tyrosine-type recombinase/integrase [Erwinia mallotivora]|uniref:tyrosine-type recombinase/integrase n=1 Tax=Erwinia mallotivora TaxID=69222 RepID=UPI0005500992|nr:tyrosine-type recombinase/integrase [Erwinia mallotivora]
MMKVNAVDRVQAAQIEQVLRRSKQETYAEIWRLNLNLALRISDLLALTFEDVQANTLRITETKTGKVKQFPINDAARAIIEKRRKENPEDVYLFQSKSNRVKAQASPVAREGVSRAFKAAGERVCKDLNVGTHSARKTRARIIYEETRDIALVSKMLNHSSIKVTEIYLDIRESEVHQSY